MTKESTGPLISISVISHRQGAFVRELLRDLDDVCSCSIEALVTVNVEEPELVEPSAYRFPVRIIENPEQRGFGANHNAAFGVARGEYFCVINPDVRLSAADPLPALLAALDIERAGVAGPRVVTPDGNTEDSARRFPTFGRLLVKLWSRGLLRRTPKPDYVIGEQPLYPDWIGGMCMMFRSSTFAAIDGFDERYFLYYEDVDLCWRLRRSGLQVVLQPAAVVIHSARRSSWRSWRYMRWHLRSMVRFLTTQAKG
jgi:GT2 family glycosyltransferase